MLDKLIIYTTDQDLVVALQLGDKTALGALYDKFSPLILSLLENIEIQEERHEELLLIVFMNIRNEINSFDPTKMRLFTWVLLLAKQVIAKFCAKEMNSFQIQQCMNYVQNKETPLLSFVMTNSGNYDEMAKQLGIAKNDLMVLIKNEINQIK